MTLGQNFQDKHGIAVDGNATAGGEGEEDKEGRAVAVSPAAPMAQSIFPKAEGQAMPIVHIELYSGRTPEQKIACARDVVDAIVKHMNTTPEATQVVFVDIDKSNWLLGGKMPAAGAKKE